MAEAPSVTIPDKPAFKASEVCELAQIQPYVLRSWESEFPELGLSKTPGGPRIYRRTDVERVLRIRDLVFIEGLTLAGVRRRFDAEQPPPQDDLFSFVAEVQAAQAKAAQANAERRTLNADAEPPPAATRAVNAEAEPATAARRTSHAETPPGSRRTSSAVAAGLPAAGGAEASDASSGMPVAGETSDVPVAFGVAVSVPAEARAALVQLKHEMRSLLDLLGGDAAASPAPAAPSPTPRRSKRA